MQNKLLVIFSLVCMILFIGYSEEIHEVFVYNIVEER